MGKKQRKQANASMSLALQQAAISGDIVAAPKSGAPASSVSSIESERSSLKRSAPHDNEDSDNEAESRDKPANDDSWAMASNKRKKLKVPSTKSSNYPSIQLLKSSRLQSKVSLDAWRDLILYVFADGVSPQWVSVSNRSQIRKFVTVMVPGLEEAMFRANVDYRVFDEALAGEKEALASGAKVSSPDDYMPQPMNKDTVHPTLAPLADMFDLLWPVRAPGDDRYSKLHSPMGTFLSAPKPKGKDDKSNSGKKDVWRNERTRITDFIATEEELTENDYVVHPVLLSDPAEAAAFKLKDGWVMTPITSLDESEVPEGEIENGSITAGREILAIDCEMVMTGPSEMALARISVVSWGGDVVLDELVKPSKPITDYVTQYSGMTPAKLDAVTTTLADIQAKLLDLLTPRTILLGHSLDSDMRALQLCHPFIVDTSLIFPHPRGPPIKQSLRYVTQKYLNREIQKGGASGHNSIEDAKACLDLARLKCEKGKSWGLPEGGGENLFSRLARTGTTYKAQGGAAALGGKTTGKTSAMIDWGNPAKGPGSRATHHIGCRSDDEVVAGIQRAVAGDTDGAIIPGGGVDFVWARMRELEAFRGWWNNARDAAAGLIPEFGPLPETSPYDSPLQAQLAALVERLQKIHAMLPPCTGLMVYSGSGDPRELSKLQAMHTKWKKEYNMPGSKWDQLSVKWTDTEEQAMRREVRIARAGMGFITIK
ncbi:RNA exonuclease [Ceratocystis lukuohia]|uniref:RNA exonuclease n=1 Tax=Ceratocystis lukuohia TaxID=2019550 RepID=A0ABR4MK15_9PEZI